MELPYRAIRAAASALLVAAAVGTGGMAGLTSALAADPVDVLVTGSVVGADGAPVPGVHLQIVETHPEDGAVAAVLVATAADGTFNASLQPWGTTALPARVTFSADEEIEIVGQSCSDTWSVKVNHDESLALAEGAPAPLRIVALTSLAGQVCGTTGTPADNGRGSGHPAVTPPPTDIVPAALGTGDGSDRHGPALSIGFAIGLLVAGVLLLPRPGTRRRD